MTLEMVALVSGRIGAVAWAVTIAAWLVESIALGHAGRAAVFASIMSPMLIYGAVLAVVHFGFLE